MTNEEAVKMLRTMQRTVYLGNRKFEDAIECAIKALSEPLQPWEVLVAQAVLSQPAEPKRGRWIKLDMHRGMADHKCTACKQECYVPTCMGEPMYAYCPNCGAKMEVNHESN